MQGQDGEGGDGGNYNIKHDFYTFFKGKFTDVCTAILTYKLRVLLGFEWVDWRFLNVMTL